MHHNHGSQNIIECFDNKKFKKEGIFTEKAKPTRWYWEWGALCLVMSQHLCCLNHCGIRHPPKHQSRHYLAKLKTAETAAANFPFTCHFLLLKIMIGICDRKCKLLLSKQKTCIELMISDIVVFVLSQMSMTFYQIIQK